MKTQYKVLLLVCVTLTLVLSALAADFTGKWKTEFDTQIGVQKYTFEFKVEGEKLTGKASFERMDQKGEVDLLEGKVSGTEISFVEKLSFQDNEIRIEYKGKISGEYLFRVRADGAKPPGSEPQMLDLYLDGKIIKSFEVIRRVTATNENLPVFMEVRLDVAAGQHQMIAAFPRLFEGLPPSFNGPNPSRLPVPTPDPNRFPPLPENATPEQIAARKAAIERFRSRQPRFDGMAIAELEIIGLTITPKALRPKRRGCSTPAAI